MILLKLISSITSNMRNCGLVAQGMGAPASEMAPRAASTPTPTTAAPAAAAAAAAPARASPQDLCVDCFRGCEQLVSALLETRFPAKGSRPSTATAATATAAAANTTTTGAATGQFAIASWHVTETTERRRGSFGSLEEGGGERRRRAGGCGWPVEEAAAEPFQHHQDAEAYIRDYRRQRDASMEAAMRKSRKKENEGSGNLLLIERLKLFDDNSKSAESKLQQPNLEDTSSGNNCSVDFLTDCCNVQRVGTVYPPDRHRSPDDPLVTGATRLSTADFLSPGRYNCLNGRKIPPPVRSATPPLPSSAAAAGVFLTERGRRQPKPAPAPPPTAEANSKARSREEPVARCSLVLPQISQDLCASFRQETQIEDVKRLKESKRLRSFQHHHQQQQPVNCSKLRIDSFLFNDAHDLSPRRREAATAPHASSTGAMSVPWTGLTLARKPRTRPRLVYVAQEGEG